MDRFTRSFELTQDNVLPQSGDRYEIEGRAIQYDAPALIRGLNSKGAEVSWYEIIDGQALADCDTSDVPMLLEHDRKEVIARSRNKSLEFDNRPDGLYIRAKICAQARGAKCGKV